MTTPALLRPLLGWLRGVEGTPAPAAGGRPRWEKRHGRKIVWRRAGGPAALEDVPEVDEIVRPSDGPCLGWLVVRRSPDQARCRQLLALEAAVTVLSRRSSRQHAEDSPGRMTFADEFMSGDHATVRATPHGFEVAERRKGGPAANGIYLNGRRLDAGTVQPLSDGDVLRLGATELVFKQVGPEGQAVSGEGPG